MGPRRAGKTTYLRAEFPTYRYATLDDLDFLEWATRDPKGFVDSLGKRAIIDEIQRAPKLTIAVKYAADNHDAKFMMTGSSMLGLLDAAADTLAGRIRIFSLPTACWGEEIGQPSHSIFDDEVDPARIKKANRRLHQAMTYGQFPEVLTAATDDEKHEILVEYKNSYFTRDLMQLSNIDNLSGLVAIFHNLARSIGSHLEVSNFARESGLSHPTTKKYLNTLLQTQLTFQLHGYQFGPAKRYIKASKSYFSDNGVLHALGIQLSEGQIIENFVIAELEKRRKLGFIKTDQFFYYKTAGGREIDLIFEVGDALFAVEIKTSTKVSARDLRNLKEFKNGLSRKVSSYLFYMGDRYETVEDIRLIPIASLFCGR
ncbi:MAG: ATP-binding protein [Proteobacteria bacterium]|nr:ATP-binding protein [Pseudomonadota bacterium]